jgi:hypothetical protein
MNPYQSCFMRATPSSRTFMTTAGCHTPLGPVGVAGNLEASLQLSRLGNWRSRRTGPIEGGEVNVEYSGKMKRSQSFSKVATARWCCWCWSPAFLQTKQRQDVCGPRSRISVVG